MTWIVYSLRIVSICSIFLGLAIALSTIDETRMWRNWSLPIILTLLGITIFGLLLPDSPQNPQDVSSFVFGLGGLNVALGILLPWIHIAIGLGQKRRVGSLLMRVEQLDQQRWLMVAQAFMLTIFALWFTYQSFEATQQPWFSYSLANANTIYMPFVLWSLALYTFLRGINRLELRQNAISYALLTLKWQRISSYQWISRDETRLILRFKPRFPFAPGQWIVTIPAFQQEAVDRVLTARLPGKAVMPEGLIQER
ncbi:hypothetical protein [Stenomitos frigidus]|uniref:DUF5673 domain-containing protein n=1 Tax=Stenomitos frigidus ULC18 TaxID=2107698 RepID=A0A2T1DSY6_9CYAN|nr:hypothetical protein [Stenomitos frigidus]PSB23619.1 hypothetical protein C7B82_30555 [Stenomitos frigidus ULC18]